MPVRHQKLLTTPQCSKRMGSVSLKDGKVESALAKALWNLGVRYRKNYRDLPGSPDIAVTKHKVAIFIDGEFWHGYDWVNRRTALKRNREYWIEKIEENMKRDRRDTKALEDQHWTVLRFWSSDVEKNLCDCLGIVLDCINKESHDRSGQPGSDHSI
ncbi:MAG: very short patch repair endonuclease [Candidatus Cryosericum sp.]